MCYAWLGEPAQSSFPATELLTTRDEFEWQRWVYEQTCNLLATAPTLTTSPRRLVLADSISRCIRASVFKTELTFARNCGLSQSSVNDLCRGASVPQLSTLLRIAFLAKVSVLDLVLGRFPQVVRDSIIASSASLEPKTAKIAAPLHRWNTKKVIEVRRSFEELLEIHPPLPMTQIKTRLSYPASTLSSKFPDLHQKAVARYREYIENRRRDFWRQVGEKLEVQLESATPLSVSEVAREIGRSRTSVVKQFPTISMRLSAHWLERRKEHWGQVRTFLQDALQDDPPSNLKAISKQLKLNHTSLYTYFPHLCREIAMRYALYLRHVRVMKKESLRSEVRSVAITLYKQGIYPSVRKVSQYLSKPLYLRSSKVALASLREVRHEFGLSSKV
jgi:transcriptional regulator with XRE-family HTH domain